MNDNGDGMSNSGNFMRLTMNPVRLRILQHLIINGEATAREIGAGLSDVPQASLYRHIKTLAGAGAIEVTAERRVRGTVEKTYRISQSPPINEGEPDIPALFREGLLSLMTTFELYFAAPGRDALADSQRDLLSLSTSTLILSDAEYLDFLKELAELINKNVTNAPAEGRKMRRITFVSSPCEETGE